MKLLYYDHNRVVRFVSDRPVLSNYYRSVEVQQEVGSEVIGKRVVFGPKRDGEGGMRLAVVCNWGDACGISTYSKYLLDALRPLVADVRVFSEDSGRHAEDNGYDVVRNWKRGQSMTQASREILSWNPDLVLVQHEFGIFPKASYWLQFLQSLDEIPYVVTLHSVYEHLDKTVCTAAIKEAVVHSESGAQCLRRLGYTNRVSVIPHGCVEAPDGGGEHFNLYQCDYPIVQFGFGFAYKGVEVALEAISLLKSSQPDKYHNIFFTYLCSESPHLRNVNSNYYKGLVAKVTELGLEDNVAIIRGYQSEQTIDNYIRTNRLSIFPYQTDTSNTVYGASGAVRIAMKNGGPVIASSSKMFDDLEGVLPRPSDAASLATEIDAVFSNAGRRASLIEASSRYVHENTWASTAKAYLSLFRTVFEDCEKNSIRVG